MSLQKTTYSGDKLSIDFYSSFLTEKESSKLINWIEKNVEWNTPSGKTYENKRCNANYGELKFGPNGELKFGPNGELKFGPNGELDTSYTINIKGKTITRNCINWNEPKNIILCRIKERLEKLTGVKYNYCVIQKYPHGKVGINPHRDKEMKQGTNIAGISIGEERTLEIAPPYWIKSEPVSIALTSGSLYVLNPPTNDNWSHSIPKDKTLKPRYSLTYRFN
jgi:hypothetical protein